MVCSPETVISARLGPVGEILLKWRVVFFPALEMTMCCARLDVYCRCVCVFVLTTGGTVAYIIYIVSGMLFLWQHKVVSVLFQCWAYCLLGNVPVSWGDAG